jgi:sigma-B regulation protein RsbU (phosphoserine phosphatase)
MLRKFVSRNRRLLETLAQCWRMAGVQEFALTDADGHVVFGDGVGVDEPLIAPVGPYGSLRIVVGVPGAGRANGFGPQLTGQAQLLTQILKREIELESMTAELMVAYDQLVAMYNISQATRSRLDLEGLLSSLLEEAVHLTGVEQGFITLRREDGWKDLARVPACLEPKDFVITLSRIIRDRRRPLVCNSREECLSVRSTVPPGVERLALTPVKVGDEVVAVIGLVNRAEAFTAGNQKLAGALAEEAGAIIERMHLQKQMVVQERMQRELEIAASIQMGLLPASLPHIEGLDIAATCRPANEVGGDFFDFVYNADGLLGVALGDVTNKGVPAALFMVVSRTLLRAAAPLHASPCRVLEHANSDIYDDLSSTGMFVTAFFAYYNAETRKLTYANAGHAPVLFYRNATATCELWKADGPPVGVLPEITSQDHITHLEEGDVLVVMSDGFNEAVNSQGERFGIQRLQEVVTVNASQPAEKIRAALLSAVEAFAEGTPQADDQTVVVLRATGE